jgi:glycosyltransferase involved in cell wall biosynthesis
MRSVLQFALLRILVFLRGLTVRWRGLSKAGGTPVLKILDFGYKSARGHHHALNQLIVRAVTARGYSAHVLASRYLDPALRTEITIPTFRSLVYEPANDAESLQRKASQTLIKTAQDLLLQRLGFLRNPRACILVHTATPWHIQSLLQVMAACRCNCLVNIFLMLPPDFEVTPELEAEQVAAYVQAWHLARRANMRVCFWAENRLLAERYRKIGFDDLKLLWLPMALPVSALRPKPVPSEGTRLRFLFIGGPRSDKGFRLVLEALELAHASSLNFEFCLRLTFMDETQRSVLERFRGPLLDLLVQPFYSDEAYFGELATAHAVLLPYDPDAYRIKNSNIVSESLACGTPVIVSNGANSLHEFVKSFPTPCYVAMPSYTAQGLLEAMNLCAANFETLAAAAKAVAPKVRKLRAPEVFVDQLFSQSEAEPGSAV